MTKGFHPHTGAYWKGYTDACDGKERDIQEDWGEQGISDYHQGYNAALAEIEANPFPAQTSPAGQGEHYGP